jgi:enhancing lycopene biosynthesis protein 2
MKTVAVILSGCGVYDGAEIQETTLSLLAIAKAGMNYKLFAPDIDQYHVINHLTGEPTEETRNVLVEAARIGRGKVAPLKVLEPEFYDALFFPGGFGVAKNLSSIAFDGADANVFKFAEQAIIKAHKAGKPIVALCIAPALLAKVLGNIEITVGNDKATIETVKKMGAKHVEASFEEIVVDKKNKIITTPCYMLDSNIVHIANGIENVVKELVKLM